MKTPIMGMPVSASVKLQIVNEVHTEMISRLMAVVINKGVLTREDAYRACYDLDSDISGQISTLLPIETDDAASLSKMIDVVHDVLNIWGKSVVTATK